MFWHVLSKVGFSYILVHWQNDFEKESGLDSHVSRRTWLGVSTLSGLTQAQLVSYHHFLSHLFMWMCYFPPGLLHCFVLFCLGLQGLTRQMVMTDVWSCARCVCPILESWQSLRGLDSSGWVSWTKGPCVTWLPAYLSPLLHRPPSVSFVSLWGGDSMSHTVLVPTPDLLPHP